MSWLAWIFAAAVLCPLWFKVAVVADEIRQDDKANLRRLLRPIYNAAMGTGIVIALLALAGFYRDAGLRGPNRDSQSLYRD